MKIMKNPKYLFIPAKFNKRIILPKLNFKEKVIGLITTVQFLHQLKDISQQLKKQNKKAIIGGQILGCNTKAAIKIENKVDCFLYIGSGKFHPLSVALSLKKDKPIYIFNPLTSEFSRLNEKDITFSKAKKKTAKIKFLSANKIGILVSTKPGQNKLKRALELKEKLEKKGKKCYIFLANDIDVNQLENFPQIEAWINTTCPGLSLENPFIWIDDI